jgi:hypothetical protein
MGRDIRITTSRAGRGWRILQSAGFLALAGGLALMMITWSEYPANPASMVGAGIAAVGMRIGDPPRRGTYVAQGSDFALPRPLS